MLVSLEEIHTKLRKKLLLESANDLLAECQNSAIKIGEYIESIEGIGTETVSLLEDYCDIVYNAYASNGSTNYAKKLQAQTIKIINTVKSELEPNKIEVVFFPYQLSMFDSFHSVYLAAKSDPSCDVYVVPIPWYEKSVNGAFGEMHYDGDQYPESIPITDWQKYDITERHPEITFIHAPFDKGGSVTSLHPDFYSKRLREHTDLLCYIPYFVCVDDEVSINHIKAEGCAYAHKVIVQSEKVRDKYIREFGKAFGDKYGNPREKFVALGSPKFDAVINAKREDFKLPETWQRLITGKKVILYNTTIGAALANNEQYLKKIRSVFETFKNRDDVVLWWRPHPLLEATYRSMRPHLLGEYLLLVENFKRECWGIYDDTPDLHRAIVFANAYYGDISSVVELFRVVNKDVLIQNTTIIADENTYKRIRFIDFIEENDNIWFSSFNSNGLYRFNKSARKTELICFLPTETIYESYRAVCLKDGKLYLAPVYAESIAIFDIYKRKLEQIPLELESKRYMRVPPDNTANFIDVHMFENYLFFVPLSFGAIVRLNTETYSIDYFDDFVRLLSPLTHSNDGFWFAHSCVVNDSIFIPSNFANIVIEFNMISCCTIMHRLGINEDSYKNICYDGNNFWIMNSDGKNVVIWNKNDGSINHVCVPYIGIHNYLYFFNDAIWRTCCAGDLVCDIIDHFDHKKNTTVTLQLVNGSKSNVGDIFRDNNAALCVKTLGDTIYVYSAQRDSLCLFNKTGMLIDEYIFKLDNDDYNNVNQEHSKRLKERTELTADGIYMTEDFYSTKLPYYLDYVLINTSSNNYHIESNKNNLREHCGDSIFMYSMNVVTNG